MSNSIDPDETAHYEPSHLDLCCLQKSIIIACGSERVKCSLILALLGHLFYYFKNDLIAVRLFFILQDSKFLMMTRMY